jgi:hypothetical protein
MDRSGKWEESSDSSRQVDCISRAVRQPINPMQITSDPAFGPLWCISDLLWSGRSRASQFNTHIYMCIQTEEKPSSPSSRELMRPVFRADIAISEHAKTLARGFGGKRKKRRRSLRCYARRDGRFSRHTRRRLDFCSRSTWFFWMLTGARLRNIYNHRGDVFCEICSWEEICQLYNGLAGGRWNLMQIAQIVALPYLRMGSKSFFS